MKITAIFKKLFLGGYWTVAYRIMDENDIISEDHAKQYEYKVLMPAKRFWYADPFILQKDDKIFVFFEVFDKHKLKGCIGVSEISEGKIGAPAIVIEKAYHMSYPCVFEYKDDCYMIPETSENKTIEIYRALKFPNEWVLDKVLADNVCSVDTTLFRQGDDIFLFAYEYIADRTYLKIYRLDMTLKTAELQTSVPYPGSSGRPAGSIFEYKGKLIRPSQDQRAMYGEKVIFNEIMEWHHDKFTERQICELSINNIFIENYGKLKRVHTFNRVNNIEVIDVRKETIEPFLIIKKFRMKIKIEARSKH